jgi:hypothetical protein
VRLAFAIPKLNVATYMSVQVLVFVHAKSVEAMLPTESTTRQGRVNENQRNSMTHTAGHTREQYKQRGQ